MGGMSILRCELEDTSVTIRIITWSKKASGYVPVYYDKTDSAANLKPGPSDIYETRNITGHFGNRNTSHDLIWHNTQPSDQGEYKCAVIIQSIDEAEATVLFSVDETKKNDTEEKTAMPKEAGINVLLIVLISLGAVILLCIIIFCILCIICRKDATLRHLCSGTSPAGHTHKKKETIEGRTEEGAQEGLLQGQGNVQQQATEDCNKKQTTEGTFKDLHAIIKQNTLYLIQFLPNPVRLAYSLFEKDVLSSTDVDQIKDAASAEDKTWNMIKIMTKGSKKRDEFMQSLRDTKQDYIADMLEQKGANIRLSVYGGADAKYRYSAVHTVEELIKRLLDILKQILQGPGQDVTTEFRVLLDAYMNPERAIQECEEDHMILHCLTKESHDDIWRMYKDGELKEKLNRCVSQEMLDPSKLDKVDLNISIDEEEYKRGQQHLKVTMKHSIKLDSKRSDEAGPDTPDDENGSFPSSSRVPKDPALPDDVSPKRWSAILKTRKQKAIKLHRKKIVIKIDLQHNLLPLLVSHNVITHDCQKEIEGITDPHTKAEMLIDHLLERDPAYLDYFAQALLDDHQDELAKLIQRHSHAMSEHTDESFDYVQ